MDGELSLLKRIIEKLRINRIIIDSYFVTENYISSLSAICKTIYIDDIGLSGYNLDVIVNYNIYDHTLNYESLYKNTKTNLLLGCNYIPLRTEFTDVKTHFRDTVKRILITTGGTDNFNVGGNLLRKIVKEDLFSVMEFNVIVGNMNPNIEYLRKLSATHRNIILHQNVSQMAYFMLSSDIAVTACGSTVYELCACGVPSICFAIADNQLMAAEQLGRDGLMLYAGDVRNDMNKSIDNIINFISQLAGDREKRRKLYERAVKLSDGKGVVRIANKIKELHI